MPVGLLLSTALAASGLALWIRRTALGCRWETAPTAVVLTAGAAAFLTSPVASVTAGALLHRITGMWNLEDLLGHLMLIVGASTTAYIFLVRLAADDALQRLYTQWIWRPLTIIIPLLVMCHTRGHASEAYNVNFEDIQATDWVALYWVILCATIIYLLAFATRILLLLREIDQDCRTVMNMYFATIVLTMSFLVMICAHVITPFYIRAEMWPIGYAAFIGWAITPAYSWWRKSRPLGIVTEEALTPTMAEDDGNAAAA